MSVKWTGIHSESGILRKSEFKEKKEELFVFGYSCKLFRDDDKALHIDQGKHLIPWMGDESLKIDRYDARGALHDLSALEAPPGGYDWRVELTRNELDVEQLCDEERYRAIHTDEDEEEMYKEEELKRLHAAGYGQVGFNYEATSAPASEPPTQEVDEPFVPTPAFKALLPTDVLLPETQKHNAIIEKTSKFIASHGTQMEILIKAKQADNPQFQFLNKDSKLHPYYTALVALVKAGKWPEKSPEAAKEEDKQQELTDEYLHPSLASTVIESAPSIPSIAYRPSADCDYRLLVSRLRGSPPPRDTPPPPGTAPLPPPAPAPALDPRVHIVRAPVLLAHAPVAEPQPPPLERPPAAPPRAAPPAPAPALAPALAPAHSTGLSLMQSYDSHTDSESDSEDSSSNGCGAEVATPPEDVQLVIDKMAAYVARNGDEFADIVRAKNDPRFTFLEPQDPYHPYYKRLMQHKRGTTANGLDKAKSNNAVVSFSIKKHKEPDPILPKPALPYESSSEDESEDPKQEKAEESEKKELPKTNIPEVPPFNHLPPVVVYKIEGTHVNNLPIVKSIEPPAVVKPPPKLAPATMPQIKEGIRVTPEKPVIIENEVAVAPQFPIDKVEEKKEGRKQEVPVQKVEPVKNKTSQKESSNSKDKRKHERKREYRSKSEGRESRRSEVRSGDRDKKEKEHNRDRKRRRTSRDTKKQEPNEIISLVDNSDDLIDLTGEQSDSKGASANGGAPGSSGRAAALLQRAGLRPCAPLPTTSLASAMVDTLESLRKRRAAEEQRRRRERRRRRDRRDHDEESSRHRKSKRRKHKASEDERSDHESSKRKKRKKDKKHSSKDKRKRRKETEVEEEMLPINIDLTNTLKELRNHSPTKELGLDKIVDDNPRTFVREESSDDDLEEESVRRRKKGREQREYSEGEWSSDSNENSTPDRKIDL